MKQFKKNLVILVDKNDNQIGTMEKMEAHKKALLHRAISVFIYNSKGEILIQRRALNKYHSSGLWANACCSHPFPGETNVEAGVLSVNHENVFRVGLKTVHFPSADSLKGCPERPYLWINRKSNRREQIEQAGGDRCERSVRGPRAICSMCCRQRVIANRTTG